MSTNTMQYGDITPRQAAYFVAGTLKRMGPHSVLTTFAESKPIPANNTDTMKFRQLKPFDAAVTPLQEGVTPQASKMEYTDITVVLKQFGQVIQITDVLSDLMDEPIWEDAMHQVAEQAIYTQERIICNAVIAGGSAQYANGTTRGSVNTPLALSLMRRGIRELRRNKAPPITRVLSASANYGTSAVEAGYVAVTHSDLEHNIRNLPGFVNTAEYGTRTLISPHELGSVENVRFVISPEMVVWPNAGGPKSGGGAEMVSTGGTNADVYPIVLFGQKAFFSVALKGKNAFTPMVLKANIPRGGDPLGQNGSVGWKAYLAGGILNPLYMTRFEVAATHI